MEKPATPPPSPPSELFTVPLSEWSEVERAAAAASPHSPRYHPYGDKQQKRPKAPKPPPRAWSPSVEKPLFDLSELSTLGRAQRRPIYISSLEAHIDRLHNQLLGLGLQYYPVPLLELDTFIGLNAKTAKGMIAGLEHDLSRARERLLELQVANKRLETRLHTRGV